MRLARVPLVQIENHVINLNYFVNAWVDETTDEYGGKPWKLWYYNGRTLNLAPRVDRFVLLGS